MQYSIEKKNGVAVVITGTMQPSVQWSSKGPEKWVQGSIIPVLMNLWETEPSRSWVFILQHPEFRLLVQQ